MNNYYSKTLTYVLVISVLSVVTRAWWIRPPLPNPACPIGYVEVHGCLPVGRFNQGPSKPGAGQPEAPPPAPPPPPHSCPTGFKWSDVFGGCVFDKKPKAQKPAPSSN